jgi:heme exporter protein D|tara:strand:- start:1429 stop:1635 length:207 start_codon:yes stop_codon:yes gene_type:complete
VNFQFDNVSHMLNMDGHGAYVWTAVVVTVLLMTWLIINPLLQGRNVFKEIAREVSREQLRQDAVKEGT